MKKIDFKRLKFNTWFYFLAFTAIIIACIWVFQLVFLEVYYRNAKFSSMERAGEEISEALSGEQDIMRSVEKCSDMGIRTVIFSEDDGSVLFGAKQKIDEALFSKAREEILKDGSDKHIGQFSDGEKRGEDSSVLYYSKKIEYSGKNAYLLLVSPNARLSEAVGVLKAQSMVITVVTIVISFILAWYFSERLSRPIGEMSFTAKRWAEGENSVSFKVKDAYTEISELADALNYAKDEVSRSGELQRDLLANVSHDLKTPLTMIKAYAEMIKDISGEDKKKREKHTQVIIDEADRLTMLVNDILNLSKLQSSVDDLEMTVINLSELTERVIGRFSDYVENEGYKIVDNVAPDLMTYADEKKVEQVIYNLLGNSINYTGEDKTVIVYLTAENDKILLEIIDSGKGISKESLDTIWERYYRFSETNTRPVKGTGLGLSIVKAILEKHKLKYGVRSKENCGSNFFVEFNRVKNE